MIAGAFLLIGALIAFLSMAASDRRKLAREDRRQWDREIRDAYVDIAAEVNKISEYRGLVLPEGERGARYQAGSKASQRIRSQGDLLRIIGTRALVERVERLEYASSQIVAHWHDLQDAGKVEYRALNAARGELLNAVKSELRVERYKPYVRPPMSRITRFRVATAVRLKALRRG
ncbi:hypothetical protein ACQPWW_22515 [Micromonospora sp. CA-240977]|uniref:hypothetical protein n=1 Tax=Micromonospora sp. CA-240977 TaxID=3239957 RepID=UPI003D9080D7